MRIFLTFARGMASSCAAAGCALGAWAGTGVTSGRPAGGGAAHPAVSTKPDGHQHATKANVPNRAPRTAPPKGFYGGVDRDDPVAVGKAFVRASYTFDTATQASTNQATMRSALWCTPSLRAKMLAELPRGSPGGQWIEWTAHQAVTTVAVHWAPQSGAPPETADAAYESYDVTVTPHGRHGWTGVPDYYVLWVTLSRTGSKAAWEVATFEVQPWFPSISDK